MKNSIKDLIRCEWGTDDPLYLDYHDNEWGVPVHDDQKLFEFLILDGVQAGLSWLTVLKKRENYRKAFDNFNPKKVALFRRFRYIHLAIRRRETKAKCLEDREGNSFQDSRIGCHEQGFNQKGI